MAQTKHGKSWIQRHLKDPYVQKAQQAGYRSRATFKLTELQERDQLFRPGMVVVDLGAAPGGWSQVVAKWIGRTGKIIALDKLPMDHLPGVIFIEGDFTETEVLNQLLETIPDSPLDWVISDMSPNLSGIMAVDQPRTMELAELAWDFARQHLRQGGGFLVKIFQGEGFEPFIKMLRQSFKQVVIRKPDASRSASRELYVLAKGYYNI